MFKKLVLVFVFVVALSTFAYAVPQMDNVVVNNSGNSGYIFTSTGTSQGNNQIGKWVNPSSVPELKGEKGDKGDVGPAGQDGLDGAIGPQGEQGVVGNDGLNGNDGINGENGKDVDPATVTNLTNMINQNTEGINNANDRITKLEDTQQIVGAEVRIHDSKKWTVTLFADFNIVRNTVDRQGIKFTYKMGESYTDKEMKRLETRIQALEVK
jgi:hypothetical protein